MKNKETVKKLVKFQKITRKILLFLTTLIGCYLLHVEIAKQKGSGVK